MCQLWTNVVSSLCGSRALYSMARRGGEETLARPSKVTALEPSKLAKEFTQPRRLIWERGRLTQGC